MSLSSAERHEECAAPESGGAITDVEGDSPESEETLVVSQHGNGVGIAVVRLPPSSDDPGDAPVAVFHVLPKVWRSDPAASRADHAVGNQVDDTLDDGAAARADAATGAHHFNLVAALSDPQLKALQFEVHEGDTIRVPSAVGRRLREATETVVGDTSVRPEKLFQRAVRQRSVRSLTGEHSGSDEVKGLWRLVDEVVGDEAAAALADPILLGMIAPHLPALEQVVRRAFLRQVEGALRVRRSNFVSFTEETLFVRGRMEPRELIERRARRRLPVTCTFDDLSHDTALWRVLRAAVRLIATDADSKLGADAARCDSRLSDVSLLGTSTAVAMIGTIEHTREARQRRGLLALARCVLQFRYPVGGITSGVDSNAAILKVEPSSMWERLLGRLLDHAELALPERPTAVRLFQNGKRPKQPDLVRISNGRLAVVDAKYKRNVRKLTELSMSDQYQCYAYANLLQATTVFVTVRTDSVEGGISESRSCLPLGQEGDGPAVAVIPVRFPRSDENVEDWSLESEQQELTEWIVKRS